MNSLLTRTTYDKVFIAKEAKKAVNTLMENAPFFEVLEVLNRDGCHNKLNNKGKYVASPRNPGGVPRGPRAMLGSKSGINGHQEKPFDTTLCGMDSPMNFP